MNTLPILWKRLVSEDGRTCERCGATRREMQRALGELTEALRPLGVEPVLEVQVMDCPDIGLR